ncbi:MAG: zinc-binding dehydrogenase [Proteobacteria bacterium]|nr:zinc-binding dehydrogenase [Pseudomonadota bacterium]
MKQIAQYQDGRIELQDVPVPTAPPGGVLVRLTHSVISVGTERMKLEQARMNLLQKARARPDQVRKVLESARTLGWRAALEKVRNRLEMPTPLGYSAAGIVEAVDAANTRFRAGERVAIGGAECAYHAELVAVPDLLAAPIPQGVENWQAAYTTVTSIALQAVRQLQPMLGERVLVIGQGLVGLLVTALLRASGAQVMGVDVAPARRPLALAMGAQRVVIAGQQDLKHEVRDWTAGYGVDAVMLATASSSNAPTEQALEALRDRGRIVVVGKTKVDLPWETAYLKEIEVRYSRSYGPGRYDPAYEWAGMDYPIGYVRFTEQRNFETCLELMRSGTLDLAALTTRRAPFAQALEVYGKLLGESGASEAGVILEYDPKAAAASPPVLRAVPREPVETETVGQGAAAAPVPPAAAPTRRLDTPVTRLDVIGAGNFARTMLLPHLAGKIPLGTVVNHTALSANHARAKFGFAHAETSHEGVLADDARAAVLIATHHHLHARLLVAALAADRQVFIEKPLCLTRGELADIEAVLAGSGGSVLVGFNRRFAGAAVALKQALRAVPGPKTASFRVMAGPLDPSSWYANHAESGGRVLGEACHFLDFFCFLFDSAPVRVSAQAVWPTKGRLPFADSITAQVEFANGCCGQLIYSAEGDSTWPKEVCTVFGAGLVAEIVNFQTLALHTRRRRATHRYQGKGHPQEMAAWAAFLRGEAPHPVPFEETRRSTLLSLATLEALQSERTIDLS